MTAPDEKTLREALHRIHHVATCTRSDCGERHSYMEIPANPKRDADLVLSAAIDELVQLREYVARLRADETEIAAESARQRTEMLDRLEKAELARTALSTLMGKGHVLKYALKFIENWAEDPHFTSPENRKAELSRVREAIEGWHRTLVEAAR